MTQLISDFHAKWGDADLPTVCIGLRAACRGQSDPWSDALVADAVRYLEGRIRLWQEPTDAIDDHVRGMCIQAVWIGRAELAERIADGVACKGLEGEGWK